MPCRLFVFRFLQTKDKLRDGYKDMKDIWLVSCMLQPSVVFQAFCI